MVNGRFMTSFHKKAVLISFLLGIVVACSLESIGVLFDVANVVPVSWFSDLTICAWPTGIFLMDTSDNLAGYVAFAVTAVMNGMLYAFIVLVIGYLISAFRRDDTKV